MNFRKLLCVILSLVIALSAFSVTAFASETEQSVGNVLHFDANSSGWNNYKKIFCHIWEYGKDSFYGWQAKKEACLDKDGDGVWTYDLNAKGVILEEGKLYVVIFHNENGDKTYNLLFDKTVIGDTAYCDGTLYENPEDSSKTTQAAFWQGQDAAVFGPEMCITSIGNVVGTCIPSVITPTAMFEDFLINKLENARTYSGKNDQDIIDDIGKALGVTKYDVSEALSNTGIQTNWDFNKSTLNSSDYKPIPPQKPENPYSSPDQISVEWAVDTYQKYEDPDLKTNRYYFLMPNGTNGIECTDEDSYYYGGYTASWYNEYASRASIYWSDTEKLDPSAWPGYFAMKSDSVDVYYADVPDFVTLIIWNNGIMYTTENDDESANYAAHSVNIPCEKYEADENPNYPDGLSSFNNMIYVIDPNEIVLGSMAPVQICSGEWYYYYGNGCYGLEKDGTDFDCIRDDHTHNDNIYTVAGQEELCGSAWDPGDPNNRMHYNDEKDIYEKVYTNVPVSVHEFTITINHAFIDIEFVDPQPSERFPLPWSGLAEVTVDGSTVIVSFDPKTYEAEAYVIAEDPTDSVVLGDVDGDGEVSIMDATAIQLYKAELMTIDESLLINADTDKDGSVSVLDATQIQLLIAELIPSL